MSQITGDGFLYPAKPFNAINPSGVSADQSLDVLLKASQGNKDRAAQMAMHARDLESKEALANREFEEAATGRAQELEFRAQEGEKDRSLQSQEAGADRELKGREGEADRKVQEQQLQAQQKAAQEELALKQRFNREENAWRVFGEGQASKRMAFENQRMRVLEERKSLEDQEAQADTTVYTQRMDEIDRETADIDKKLANLSQLKAVHEGIFNSEQGAGFYRAVTSRLNGEREQLSSLFDRLNPLLDRLALDGTMQTEKAGLLEKTGAAALAVISGGENLNALNTLRDAGTNRMSRENLGELADALSSVGAGTSEPTKAKEIMTTMLGAMDRYAGATDSRGRRAAQEEAASAYKRAQALGMDTDVIDRALWSIDVKMRRGAQAGQAAGLAEQEREMQETGKSSGAVKGAGEKSTRVATHMGKMVEALKLATETTGEEGAKRQTPLLRAWGNSPAFNMETGKPDPSWESDLNQMIAAVHGAEDPEGFLEGILNDTPSDDPAEWNKLIAEGPDGGGRKVHPQVVQALKEQARYLETLLEGRRTALGVSDEDRRQGGRGKLEGTRKEREDTRAKEGKGLADRARERRKTFDAQYNPKLGEMDAKFFEDNQASLDELVKGLQ